MTSPMAPVLIVDRPCGSGKTTELLRSFNSNERYLVVVPFLGEADRVIRDACVPFVQPSDEVGTKSDSLEMLLDKGQNIVTTHSLYQRVARLARWGDLEGYNVVIDEVPDTCRHVDGVSPKSFKEFYLGNGYAELTHDGRVLATKKWDENSEQISDTLSPRLHGLANAGMLHLVNDTFFMWALPKELLTKARSFTVYTYLARGSMLLPFLDKLGVPYVHDMDPLVDRRFRRKAKELITVRDIPALRKIGLSYSRQTDPRRQKRYGKAVGQALKNLRQRQIEKQDGQVDMSKVMLTCAKENWYHKGKSEGASLKPGPFASNSRMFRDAEWVANTTRGTNDYIDCTHAVYLYDQNMNQFIRRWLGLTTDPEAQDRYALTELVQWVYRTRVRQEKPIVLYLPSKRMRGLLQDWMDGVDLEGRTPEPMQMVA